MKSHSRIKGYLSLLITILLLTGCEQKNEAQTVTESMPEKVSMGTQAVSSQINHIQTNSQFTIDNKRYLYDISEHSIEELKLLLQRAEEITQTGTEGLEDLEIVMILHGPDIGWFTLDSYEENKELVDLAKKLDTFDIIDLKVCKTAMEHFEIDRKQIPSFIESVPYAPNEISRLSKNGYIHL